MRIRQLVDRGRGGALGAVGLEVALIVALIVFNGILAGSELAIVSARKVRLQQRAAEGDAGAQAALALSEQPNRFLSTAQIGITLVGILAGAFGGATVAETLADGLEGRGIDEDWAGPLAVALVVLGITYLSLIVGELVPKRLALAQPERVASIVARPMNLLATIARPAVALLSLSTEAVLRVLRLSNPGDEAVTEEELRMLIQQGADAGVIDEAEQQMAFAVLRLGDRTVGDIMTPRTEVSWVDASDGIDQILNQIANAPHDRFPVCLRSPDDVLGVVAVKELFAAARNGEVADIRSVMRPALFIPESATMLTALERFREGGPFGIVIDEYGGMAGVATLTDLLEIIVGQLPETVGERDEEPIADGPDGSWLVDGRLSTERLRTLLGVRELPRDGEFQTLAGLVMDQLGHVPSTGAEFETLGYRFIVVDMDGRRIDRVMIAPVESDETAELPDGEAKKG